MPPALRDRYLLGERLGSGGMADVHRATDTILEREVAVKVLREAAVDDSDRARFVREARTLAALSHRNLVMVLDAGIGDEDDRPFLVMELVEGRSLADALGSGPMPAEEVAVVGADLAAGLAYAHERGVVHRDVKPANVLLSDEGRVKLADFGIARLIGDTVRHTRTGTAIGTAAYLSPEQVRGEDVTGAADVYALGLLLLEALTGTRAFPGSATEAALARLHRDPEIPSDLPDGWAPLLTAMTAADPAARPGADEAARVLAQGVPSADGAGSTALLTAPVATTVTPLAGAVPGASPTHGTAQGAAHAASAHAASAAAPAAAAAAAAPGGAAAGATATGTPALDRAGDALARVPGRMRRRWASLPAHQRGVAGAVVSLVALVVLAGMAAGAVTGGPAEPGTDDPSPADVELDFTQLPASGDLGGSDPSPSDPSPSDQATEGSADQAEQRKERRKQRFERRVQRELQERQAQLSGESDDDD